MTVSASGTQKDIVAAAKPCKGTANSVIHTISSLAKILTRRF